MLLRLHFYIVHGGGHNGGAHLRLEALAGEFAPQGLLRPVEFDLLPVYGLHVLYFEVQLGGVVVGGLVDALDAAPGEGAGADGDAALTTTSVVTLNWTSWPVVICSELRLSASSSRTVVPDSRSTFLPSMGAGCAACRARVNRVRSRVVVIDFVMVVMVLCPVWGGLLNE